MTIAMDDKRPPSTHWPSSSTPQQSNITPAAHLAQGYVDRSGAHPHSPSLLRHRDVRQFQNVLPPILPAKRVYDEDDWQQQQPQGQPSATHPKQTRLAPPLRTAVPSTLRQDLYQLHPSESSPRGRRAYAGTADVPMRRYGIEAAFEEEKVTYVSPRRTPSNTDSFVHAAEMGARAQSAVDSASGDVFETYELGKTIVSSSKLYANQRRSNRLLPGGSDSTTAACYMIGGTPDSVLSPLVSRVSPCDPREERCKAVERVLKDKTRGAICALNGENPREARADNLAAVRICEVVADILVAYSSRRLMESRKELIAQVQRQDMMIKELKEEVACEKRKRSEKEAECWCKGQPERAAGIVGSQGMVGMGDLHSFEKNKLLRRGVLTSSGHRSLDSDRGSNCEVVDKDGEGGKFAQ